MLPDGHVCWFVVGVLGVWRVSHLVTAEDGPWGIIATARGWAGHGVLGQLLDCFNCTSLWVSAVSVLALPAPWTTRVAVGLALSGGAILLERVTARQTEQPEALPATQPGAPSSPAPVAMFVEGEFQQEGSDGVLRR